LATVLLISRDRRVRDALGRLLRDRSHTLSVHVRYGTPTPDWLWWASDVAFFDLAADSETGLATVGLAAVRAPARAIAVIDRGGHPRALDRLAAAVRLGVAESMRKPVDRLDAEALFERLHL
jgi:DNA-binding NtrC family response regulator